MKKILMIGSGKQVKGGISALVENYFDSGLVDAHRVFYLDSHIDGSKTAKAIKFIQAAGKFFYYLFFTRIDIVHVHSASRASFYRKSFFLWAAKAFGRKSIFHLHGGEFGIFFHKECGRLRKWFIRKTLRTADVLICLSGHWHRILSEITEETGRIITLYNCVKEPSRRKAHREADEICVLFMGKLDRGKGVFDLIDAAGALKSNGKKVRFILCGDGERGALEKAAADKQLSDRVVFPGWIKDKSAYYHMGDIFVLPSYNEGLPMVLIEAASYGLPLVSTRVGGIPDIVVDELNGFLVNPGDVGALKERIAALADSAKLRQDMGREGMRLVARRFSTDAVTAKLSQIYESLV